jgi:DNA-binding response OmpR family regulator
MERELLPVRRQDPLSRIRQASYVPIIAVGSDQDWSTMLEFGADVYMAKPPSLRELIARVRTLLRRKNIDELPSYRLNLEDGETLDGTN